MAVATAELQLTNLRVDQIIIPPDARPLDREDVDKMADSIEMDGLLQPIGVRQDPLQDNAYVLVFGGHRIAAFEKLEREEIPAYVLDMDAEEAEVATAAENLFRTELSAPLRYVALDKWTTAYKKKHPETVGRGAGGRGRPETDAPAFDEVAGAKIGIAPATVRGITSVTKKIGVENLKYLHNVGCSGRDLDKIAAVKDDKQRNAVIGSVIGGLKVDDAVERAQAPDEPSSYLVNTPAGNKIPAGKSLSDDEWYAEWCCKLTNQLADDRLYRRDCLIYREILEHLEKYKKAVKKLVNKNPKDMAHLEWMISQHISLDHPKHWLICGTCHGKGKLGSNTCDQCWGRGYKATQGNKD